MRKIAETKMSSDDAQRTVMTLWRQQRFRK